MRRALALLGARGTVALALIVLVFGVVGIAKLTGGNGAASPGLRMSDGGYTPSTVDPTTGDDGVTAPTSSEYPDDPEVRATANSFATAWLRRDLDAAAWHAGLSAYATDALSSSLDGVDPKTVPARRVTDAVTVTLRTVDYAEAAVPVDSGTLRLLLQKQDGAWLVDGVDWTRPT